MGTSASKPKLCSDTGNSPQKCSLKQIIWGGGPDGIDVNSSICNSKYGLCRSLQYLVEYLIKENYVSLLFKDGDTVLNNVSDDVTPESTKPVSAESSIDTLLEEKLKIKIGKLNNSNYKEDKFVAPEPYKSKLKTLFQEELSKISAENEEEEYFINELKLFVTENDNLNEQEIFNPQYLIDKFIMWKLKTLIVNIVIYYVQEMFKLVENKRCSKISFSDDPCFRDSGVTYSVTNNEDKLSPDHPLCWPNSVIGGDLSGGESDGKQKISNNYSKWFFEGDTIENSVREVATVKTQYNHWSRASASACRHGVSGKEGTRISNLSKNLYKHKDRRGGGSNKVKTNLVKKSHSDDGYFPYEIINESKISETEDTPDNINEYYFLKNTLLEWIKSHKFLKRLYELREWVKVISSGACSNCTVVNCNADLNGRCKRYLFGGEEETDIPNLDSGHWDTNNWTELAKKRIEASMNKNKEGYHSTDSWWETTNNGNESEWSKKCRDKVIFNNAWIKSIPKKIKEMSGNPTIPSNWWEEPKDSTEVSFANEETPKWKSSKIMNACKNTVETKKGKESPWMEQNNDGSSWRKIAREKLESNGGVDNENSSLLSSTDDWWLEESGDDKSSKKGTVWLEKCRQKLNMVSHNNYSDEWLNTSKNIIENKISTEAGNDFDDTWWKNTDRSSSQLLKRCREKGDWDIEWTNKAHKALTNTPDEKWRNHGDVALKDDQLEEIVSGQLPIIMVKSTKLQDNVKNILEDNMKEGGFTDSWWKNRPDKEGDTYGIDNVNKNPWQNKCKTMLKKGDEYGKQIWSKDERSSIWGSTFHSGADVINLQKEINTSLKLNKLYSDYDIKNKTILGDIDKKKTNQYDTIKTETQNKDKLLHFIHSTKNKINSNTSYKNAMIGLLIIVIIVTIIFVGLLLKKYNLINLEKLKLYSSKIF